MIFEKQNFGKNGKKNSENFGRNGETKIVDYPMNAQIVWQAKERNAGKTKPKR